MTSATEKDKTFMQAAIEEARCALTAGEVPVGAVVIAGDRIVARAFNSPIRLNDPSAHAELLALREAGRVLQNYRLTGATLYVTIEPCAMCAGAIIQARLARVVYGADDPKWGAVTSLYRMLEDARFNHTVAVTPGILKKECGELLSSFFRQKRIKSRGADVQGRLLPDR